MHKMRLNRTCLCFVLPMLVLMSSCSGEVFPEAHWQLRTPEESGLDASILDSMRDYMQGRGCLIRHGYQVYSWGDCTERGDVASAVKPWYSFFLFKALEDGRIENLDVAASAYVPCLNDLNAELGYKDSNIRFRNLATQTSCYGVREAPGAAFDYNDWQMALFVDTLFLGVYGVTWPTVDEETLHPLLTDVLQCEDGPSLLAFGDGDRAGRLSVSPRDFCRFGYLFLKEGRWKDRQILSADAVRHLTTEPLPGTFPRTGGEPADMCPDQRTLGSQRIPDDQCDHKGSYSWLWWVNGVDRDGKRHWPDAPLDTYAALGHQNGMRGMAVMPSLDIVLSWNDTALGDMDAESGPLNTVFRLVRASVKKEPVAGQIIVAPDRPACLVRNEDKNGDGHLDSFFMCGPGDPEGFLYRGERKADGTRDGDQQAIIEKMKDTGANCLYLAAVRSHGGDGDGTQNPFIDSDPGKGLDENMLQQWESWFRALDENGIVVFFIFYDDSADPWNTGDVVGPEEEAFLDGIVRRFEHHKHWIWCVAEEYGEAFSAARATGIATVIRGADKHDHVIAVHKNDSLVFDEFAESPVIDQFAVQYNVETAEALHDGMVLAEKNAQGRYNVVMAEAAGFGIGAEARKKFWACAMAGVGGMALDWCFDAPDRPSTEDLKACGNLVRFFESSRFDTLAPHDELAAGLTRYVLAVPGDRYIAYTWLPGETMGLKSMRGGVYSMQWFDPVSGSSLLCDNVQVAPGDQQWERPSGFTHETAVYLQRTGGR